MPTYWSPDSFANAMELVCYVFTTLAAVFSYLLTVRH